MVLRFLDFYDSVVKFSRKIYGWFTKVGIHPLGDAEEPIADALDKVDDVNEFSRGAIWAFFMGK